MGLDSVELLMELEIAFGLSIPDEVCVKLTTSRAVVAYVAAVRKLNQSPAPFEQQRLRNLATAIRDLRQLPRLPDPDEILDEYFQTEPPLTADYLSERLALSIPDLPRRTRHREKGILSKLGSVFRFNPGPLSVRNLNNAINAQNFSYQRGTPQLEYAYEAYLVVMLILRDEMGLDLVELTADKSFTDDYGID